MTHIVKQTGNSKWMKIKDALKDGLSGKKAKALDFVLENTRRDFVARQKLLMENASASAVSTEILLARTRSSRC